MRIRVRVSAFRIVMRKIEEGKRAFGVHNLPFGQLSFRIWVRVKGFGFELSVRVKG
jgi:hypothetical protein